MIEQVQKDEHFRDGLERIISNIDSLDEVSFKKAVFKLHEDFLDKDRKFVPIEKEQINLALRVIMFPLVFLVIIATSFTFLISSTLFAGIMYRTGQGFLKKQK